MMDQHRMWTTDCIVGLLWELPRSTGRSARIPTMWMRISRNKNREPMMDQHTMYRNNFLLLESVNIRLYISDL